ncbi:hypothetical protein [Bradyrhizobium jicamae]|uniref:hypothetical protein n=1 Tax=Bradyrhizobium jicamae TaxID=280332 RepID=UPI002012E3CD|nr:hypothetical protein [Bradyrhizobium jicamae]
MNHLLTGTNLVCISAALVWIWPANAHDHTHPELDDWYKSLRSEQGEWCCDGADVNHLTDPQWTIKDGQYQVFLEGEWVKVPPEKLVKGNNRVGFALAWRMYIDGHPVVRCFMPGASG